MYKFSIYSKKKLLQCEPDLQAIFNAAITDSPFDFGISCGYRSQTEQNRLYNQGRITEGDIVTNIDGITKKGKHNYNPSKAGDMLVTESVDLSNSLF